jgi:general secretion pathway protein N
MARPLRRDRNTPGASGVRKRNQRLVVVGVAALACFAIATLPAGLARGLLERAGLSADRFSGTVWSGAASNLTWRGASLGDLGWRLRPLALLRARAAAEISLTRPDGSASAVIAATLDGTLDLSNVRFDLPIEFFAQVPTGMARGWHGRVNGTLTELQLVHGWPSAARGMLHLADVVMPQLGGETIGSFDVVLPDPHATADDLPAVTARVTDTGGSLAVDAALSLAAGRNFLLEGTVAARGGAPQGLVRSLQYLGPADAGGRRQFGVSGTL